MLHIYIYDISRLRVKNLVKIDNFPAYRGSKVVIIIITIIIIIIIMYCNNVNEKQRTK